MTRGTRNQVDDHARRLERKMQLIRGRFLCWRGVRAGSRFGVGRGVRILYPHYLTAGSDVTISDSAFINALGAGGVDIGDHTSFDVGLWLHCGGSTGDVGPGFFHIGSYSYIGPYGVMGAGRGGITVGDHVVMGPMVNIVSESHVYLDRQKRIDEQGTVHKGVVIKDDCWIGAKVAVLDGVTLGRGCVIGAGAIVTRSVPPYSVAVGNPARVIKQRKPSP